MAQPSEVAAKKDYLHPEYVLCLYNPNTRFKEHNSGKSVHTSKFKPWKLIIDFTKIQKGGIDINDLISRL